MDLKRYLPGKDEEQDSEYYWAISIEPSLVQAGIWRISGEVAQIITSSPPTPWDTKEDIVNSADTALSAAIQNFPEDLKEPSKSVFGVISSWVSEGQIKAEYLEIIKKVCAELSLKPAGFVILTEALAHYLKADEGSPLNAVLVGVYSDALEISMFNLGNMVGTTQVARSVSVVDDVVEGLSRFSVSGALPSRFILYNGKDAELEDAKQSLIKADWGNYPTVKFLHAPKIELVSSETKIDAVSLAGASEMADVKGIEKVKLVGDSQPVEGKMVINAPVDDTPDVQEDEHDKELENTVSPETLGFTSGDNFRPVEMKASQQSPEINDYKQLSENGNMNKGSDQVNELDYDPQEQFQQQGETTSASKGKDFSIYFKKLNFMPALINKLSSMKKVKGVLGLNSPLQKIFTIGILILVGLILASFAAWWYFPKAVVTVYLAPQRQEERVDILVDSDAQDINVEGRVLPGQVVSTSVSDERTISTTGTKRVGERAKGEVTMYRVGTSLTLDQGTVIRGPNNLRFTLDSDVEVASGSAGTPGTATASVTAEDIGAEYNLASGNTFTVGNYSDSDIEAKNENEFSGGSSREISAVSERDRVNLEEELSKELAQRALEELKQEIGENQLLIEESIEENVEKREFSADVDEEADTLRLSMTKSVEVYTINETQLINLAKDVLKNKVSEGFVLRDENIEVNFDLKEESEGVYEFDTRIIANLLPEVDPEKIKQNIKGKYPLIAQEYLDQNVPGFIRADLRINPNLPGRLNTLPRMAKNIEVEISAEQ